eukprot:2271580-Pyramimonas_sp.AAC.1
MHHEAFEHELEALKGEKGVTNDTDLTAEDLKELVERSKKVYEKFGECSLTRTFRPLYITFPLNAP